MMKHLILIFTTLIFAINLSGQNKGKIDFQLGHKGTLIVNSNETKRISASMTSCEKFIMHDNSTIIIDGYSWKLDALQAEIGNNCKIIANGNHGASGIYPGRRGYQKDRCKTGKDGRDAPAGSNGTHGKNIEIKALFTKLGNLKIETNGGNGGNGAQGGEGGKGGGDNGHSCGAGDGGRGGNGGAGGIGGNGGQVTIHYGFLDNKGIKPEVFTADRTGNNIISVNNKRGNNGSPGAAGNGGGRGNGSGGSTGRKGYAGSAPTTFGTNGKIDVRYYQDDCFEESAENSYALIISVSNYETAVPTWSKQAAKLASTLETKYDFDDVKHLDNPSAAELRMTLLRYLNKGRNANVLIYLSGHGYYHPVQNVYGFLFSDTEFEPFNSVFANINKGNVKNLLFISDVCYSGKILDDYNIDTRMPTSRSVLSPYLYCGLSSKTIITAGYESEKVDIVMTDHLNTILTKNTSKQISSEALFYEMVGTDKYSFKTQRPSIGRLKGLTEGSFLFHLK